MASQNDAGGLRESNSSMGLAHALNIYWRDCRTGNGGLVETAEQLHAAIGDWARQWPHTVDGLEGPALLEAGHRQFEAIMCRTPAALQDEIYEAMHLLMHRLGLCTRPRWLRRR
jgi:hypothetical protein